MDSIARSSDRVETMALRVLTKRLPALRRAAPRSGALYARALSTETPSGPTTEGDAPEVASSSVIAATSIAQATPAQRLQFFPFSQETEDALFPEGVARRMDETFELVGHRHILLRDAALEIIQEMQQWTPESAAKHEGAFLLDGERGAGKTFALHQIVQFAREAGWVVLFVPHARSWCYEAPYVMKSPYVEGKFDVDVYGVELLQHFLRCHRDQIATIKLRGDYGDRYYPFALGAKPKTPGSFDKKELTLRDLVENGIADEELACAAVVDLRTELSNVTEFPVLVAVDEYNTWFEKTVFGFEGEEVFPSDISVIDTLKDIDAKGFKPERKLKNGLFVAAVTSNYPSKADFKKQVDYRKLRKTLRTYSKEELEQVVAYYNEVSFLHGELRRSLLRMETVNGLCSNWLCFVTYRQADGVAARVLPAHDQVAPAPRVRPRVLLVSRRVKLETTTRKPTRGVKT